MTLGICAVCGYHDSEIQHHHLAGRANYPKLTIPTCRSCHTEMHKRLSAHGVDLRHDVERSSTDRLGALFIGYSVAFQLHLERHPIPLLSPDTVLLMTRLLSRDMDRLEPADRPGRRSPDPTIRVEEVMPAETREGGDEDMLLPFMQCALEVLDSIDPTWAEHDAGNAAFKVVASDPLAYMAKAEQTWAASSDSQQLMTDIAVTVETIGRLLRFMATHDPETEWPADMLAEAQLWGDTMRRILQRLIDLAGLTEEVAS